MNPSSFPRTQALQRCLQAFDERMQPQLSDGVIALTAELIAIG